MAESIAQMETGKVQVADVEGGEKPTETTPGTSEAPAPIVPLAPSVSQKICADQVIGTLATALKELLENSLDAGASQIHLQIYEFGMGRIEVIDNGSGVQESDFDTLAKSHTTSKLSEFENLGAVATFGFRGEALNSLCRLCNGIIVVTKNSNSKQARCLEYDASGTLIKNSLSTGNVGTKVVLKKLFATLPVRQKVFASKCKNEFSKAMHLVDAYSIITEKVRIRVVHHPGGRKAPEVVTQTQGGSLFENMVIVLGGEVMKDLVSLPSSQPVTSETCDEAAFQLQGYVSSCAHGRGRSAKDKQYFYIRGRPCDLPKVQKLVNHVYHLYNRKQYPVVVLNVLPNSSGLVDFNLDPDKRKVVLTSEASLLQQIEGTLTALFEKLTCIKPLDLSRKKASTLNSSSPSTSSPKLTKFFSLTLGTASTSGPSTSGPPTSGPSTSGPSTSGPSTSGPSTSGPSTIGASASSPMEISPSEGQAKSAVAPQVEQTAPGLVSLGQFRYSKESKGSAVKKSKEHKGPPKKFRKLHNLFRKKHPTAMKLQKACMLDPIPESHLENSPPAYPGTVQPKAESQDKLASGDAGEGTSRGVVGWEEDMELEEADYCKIFDVVSPWWEQHAFAPKTSLDRKEVSLEVNLETLKSELQTCETKPVAPEPDYSAFTVPLTGPSSEAEQELSRQVTKDKFLKMRVIGQFNKAFILTELDGHLFVIDQHAADEKFNFETLRKETKTEIQKLLFPRPLNLNLAQELLFVEHSSVFFDTGFRFTIDQEAPVSQKIKITAVPTFLNEQFGVDDILDMLHQLQEAPYNKPEPSRMKSILASRACRSSIMMGDDLDMPAMRKLIDHMSTMDHPWNCPHGRPTMRHLMGYTWDYIED